MVFDGDPVIVEAGAATVPVFKVICAAPVTGTIRSSRISKSGRFPASVRRIGCCFFVRNQERMRLLTYGKGESMANLSFEKQALARCYTKLPRVVTLVGGWNKMRFRDAF